MQGIPTIEQYLTTTAIHLRNCKTTHKSILTIADFKIENETIAFSLNLSCAKREQEQKGGAGEYRSSQDWECGRNVYIYSKHNVAQNIHFKTTIL